MSSIQQQLRPVYLHRAKREHVPDCNGIGIHRAFSRDQVCSTKKTYDQEILFELSLLGDLQRDDFMGVKLVTRNPLFGASRP